MTPAPPPPAFLNWWETHPLAYAVTAAEAWLCKRYQDQWKDSTRVEPTHRAVSPPPPAFTR
jgi:hypothetical protein